MIVWYITAMYRARYVQSRTLVKLRTQKRLMIQRYYRTKICGFWIHHSNVYIWYEQGSFLVKESRTDSNIPDNKVNGANMGPTWVLPAPDGPHVGPINLAIKDHTKYAHGASFVAVFCCVAIIWLPQCQWSNPVEYRRVTASNESTWYNHNKTKHNKTMYKFYGIYCSCEVLTKIQNQGWLCVCGQPMRDDVTS